MKPGKLAKYSSPAQPDGDSRDVAGDVAAQVFARLDGGGDPRAVVTELAVAPETVDYLWRTWARLRGRVIVSPENIVALAAAVHALGAPRTPAEVVQLVQELGAEEQRACSRCGRDVGEYCYSCPGEAAAKARESRRRSRRKTTSDG